MSDKQLDLLLREGERLLAQNRMKDALSHYQKLCDIKPDCEEAWFMLGAINLEIGTPAQARDCSHRATQLDSEFPEAWLVLGKAQAILNDLNSAEESTHQAIKLRPEYTEARFNLAVIQQTLGKPEAALESYGAALAQQPDSVEGWHQRAVLEEKLNLTVDAEASTRRALALDPAHIDSRLILARCLLSQCRTEESIQEFEYIQNQHPNNCETLEGLSTALETLGRPDRAAHALQKALTIDPQSVSNWFRLALLDYQQGNLERALKHSQKTTSLKPDFEPARVLQGDLLRTMGKIDEALICYESVITRKGTDINVNAIAGKAMVLDKLGRHDEAYNTLRPHFDNDRSSNKMAVAYANICSHAGSCDEAIEIIQELLSKPQPGIDTRQEIFDQQELNHHLAKLYDKSGNYDLAFTHFTNANNYKKRTSPFDPEKHQFMVEGIITDYTSERLKTAPTSSCDSEQALFIVGMPRSGTTLVEQILCSHPKVFGGGEQEELPKIASELDNRPNSNRVRPPLICDLTAENLGAATDRYLDTVGKISSDALHITDKMLYNFYHIGLIQLMFPHCKVIHCTRDPLDTCLSTYFQKFSGYQGFATDLRYIGIYYRCYHRLMDHWQRTLDLPIHTIRYEALVDAQETETRRLLNFCNLEWDNNCMEFYKNPRVALTASYNQIRSPIYSKSKNRWKNYEEHLDELKILLEE